ncbi:MAG: hypothetical protein VX777_06195 [Chlamydiota bacterium]|nr:hypothetical protein [Chlamydiota bacterium]
MKQLLTICMITSIALLPSCSKKVKYSNRGVIKEKYVHKYGVEVQEQDWASRGKNGKVISTLDDGVTVTKHYRAGKLHGDAVYTFPHSDKIEKIESYQNDDLIKVVYHDEMGTPINEIDYTPDGYKIVTVWSDSGAPMSKEMYSDDFLIDGEYYTSNNLVESKIDNGNGTRVVRDQHGDLVSRDLFESGVLTYKTEFYSNGAIKSVTPYVHNVIHGERKTYQQGGEPDMVEKWVTGAKDGTTVAFKNGEKFAEVPYQKGRKDGIERRFRDGKIVVEEITWKNGQRHGPTYTFVDGTLSRTIWYFHGKAVSKSTYDQKSTRRTRTI